MVSKYLPVLESRKQNDAGFRALKIVVYLHTFCLNNIIIKTNELQRPRGDYLNKYGMCSSDIKVTFYTKVFVK